MKFAAAALLLSVTAMPSMGAVLDLQFDIDMTTAFDYPTLSQVDFAFNGTVNMRLDFGDLVTSDYGTAIHRTGPMGSATIDSPLTQYVSAAPIGLGLNGLNAYSLALSVLYSPQTYVEDVGGQGGAYSSDGFNHFAYDAVMRIGHRPVVGPDTVAYPLQLEDILRVVGLWYRDPSIAYFNESWRTYTAVGTDVIYLSGRGWSDYTPTLTAAWLDGQALNLETMEVAAPAPVPLPAAGFLLAGAFAGLGALKARRKRAD
ncbi:VPLPA-CTERM sorting domain-containing protein [Frigidibacter sp. MR17.14]|uniref:VPLPA-CTERM sorting domain-containing protein n=1 Tax=Frigidibacter sp. MR17.14 TaxID=3126509 RepID=UPI003012AA6B